MKEEVQEVSKLVSEILSQFNTLTKILKEPDKAKVQDFVNNLQVLLYRYVELVDKLKGEGYVVK
jgi:hypothetical protein